MKNYEKLETKILNIQKEIKQCQRTQQYQINYKGFNYCIMEHSIPCKYRYLNDRIQAYGCKK